MFIKVKHRQLQNGVSIDFRLTKTYREYGKVKTSTLKTWTIRQGDLRFKSDRELLLERIEEDLEYIAKVAERKKVLAAVKRAMRKL